MTRSFLIIISFLLCLTGQSDASSAEEKYFETRDRIIHQFEKTGASEDIADRQALVELEKQIRPIVGPVRILGFAEQGKINLETLLSDLIGFDQVDGIRFDSNSECLFVTTSGLLGNYLRRHRNLATDLSELAKDATFYSSVFYSDAAVMNFAEVPIKYDDKESVVNAFLGFVGQTTGHFLPKNLFVFVTKGNRIFMVSSPVQEEINEIAECNDVWGQFEKKASDAFDAYSASQLEDKKALNDFFRYEEEGFEAYKNCFSRKAKNEQFFAPLTGQAQSIVDRILKD